MTHIFLFFDVINNVINVLTSTLKQFVHFCLYYKVGCKEIGTEIVVFIKPNVSVQKDQVSMSLKNQSEYITSCLIYLT